jgi:HEXXH motif-containing protein
MTFVFAPSAELGRQTDSRMHSGLADSLTYLGQAVQSHDAVLSADLFDFGGLLQAGLRIPALSFSEYYSLVPALQSGDLVQSRALLAQMQARGARGASQIVRAVGHPGAEALNQSLSRDPDELLHMAAVSDTTLTDFTALLGEGFGLMDAHLPDLAAEIRAIVHEILLGHAQPGSKVEFDGASHYQYWGLLMLNPKHHKTPLAVVEVLAHESAHSLLFGQTIEEPLVLNPDEELFTSPLRPDPRPMDGILHATFVSARMAWAMEQLADVSTLSREDRQQAADAAAKDRQNFVSGLSTVHAHGRLTETGALIMAAAEDWINR